MKQGVVLILLFFGLFACISHHYRIDGDRMTMVLKYPDAKKVVLFCSFDGFKPREANKVSSKWESIVPAGETFRYFYQVDDQPFVPECAMKEKDDFGFENCIYDPHL